MLTREENELLTRVTGDTPGGRMMRRYWWPVAWSDDLIAPGASSRSRICGGDLVVGREAGGALSVRDADGARAFPVRDAGGLLWSYLGPAELEPAFPAYDWTAMPRNHVAHMKYVEHANWLQCAEGTIDTTHSWFLHRGVTNDWKKRTSVSWDLAPRLEAEDTPYGFRYCALRRPNDDPDATIYAKITVFVFPSTGIIARPMEDHLPALVQIFVPIDDETTMVYSMMHSFNGRPVDEPAIRDDLKLRPGIDQSGNWRPGVCEPDGWRQDRAAMKLGDWTGVAGFPNQDVIVQESMGRIVDRTREHLGTSDVAIIRMRRRMLESVRRVIDGGAPIGLDAPIDYGHLWATQEVIPLTRPWQTVGPPATWGMTEAVR